MRKTVALTSLLLLLSLAAPPPSRASAVEPAGKSDVRLALAGDEYGLKVSTKSANDSPYMFLDDAKLVLSRGDVSQVIYDLRGAGDVAEGGGETETVEWKLLWAGDLDGDRKLDLYVQVSWHYDIVQRKLFLSSGAGAGRLVREAAELDISGC